MSKKPNKIISEEKEISENKIIEKSEICKARYSEGFIYINFKGFGLMIPNVDNHTEDEIKVYYQGNIGKPDFKYRI